MKKYLFFIVCLFFVNNLLAQSVVYEGTNKNSATVKPLEEALYKVLKVYDAKTKEVRSDNSDGMITVSKVNDVLTIDLIYDDIEYGSMVTNYIINKVIIFPNRIEYVNSESGKTCLTLTKTTEKAKLLIKEHYMDGSSVCYEIRRN